MKLVVFFPGQGSQYVGMGSSLCKEDPSLFTKADQVLKYSLSSLMLEGPEDKLTLTQNTQPAILTHSIALFKKLEEKLKEKELSISYTLGHSVGEYAALVAAGSLQFEDAVKMVHLRGKFMQEAVPAGKGSMYALLKVPEEMVKKACEVSSQADSEVMPANFNEPNQIVISGHKEACERAVAWLKENHNDPFRSVELKVSAPFHSSLMLPAAKKLKVELKQIQINSPQIPYIANVDAKTYDQETSSEVILNNLVKQVDGSVMWSQSVGKLSDDCLCLEVGPGKVLKGLARKINRNLKVISLDSEDGFQELEESLS